MAHISEGKNGKLVAHFDSVRDVINTIDELGWTPQREKASDRRGRDGNFYSFGSLDEALNIYRTNPESIRQFSVNDERLVNRESPGKDVEFSVTGDYIDIDRYLEGIPEVMGNAVMGNPKTVFATINVLNSAVHYTSPEYMLHKQKRILRLVDWLETQNIRTQVVMSEDSSVSFTSVIVKQFHDPFDLNELAIGLHPDFFRRVFFLIMEQSKTWSYGYGSSMDYDNKMKGYRPNPEDGLYIYVGGYLPYGGSSNKTKGIPKLDEVFTQIEDDIEQIIKDELTYNEEPLVVYGAKDAW